MPEDRQDLEGPRGTTESPRVGINTPKRRWVASHWGLLLLGILVILILGSVWVSLVYGYSPEGRLRSYVPESIRETCRAEYTTSLIKIHYVATDGYPAATAGLFCFWSPNPPPEGELLMTYLLFSDRKSLLENHPGKRPADCFTDEAGHRICIDRYPFGHSSGFGPYSYHIVWTDGSLFIMDATVGEALYR